MFLKITDCIITKNVFQFTDSTNSPMIIQCYRICMSIIIICNILQIVQLTIIYRNIGPIHESYNFIIIIYSNP